MVKPIIVLTCAFAVVSVTAQSRFAVQKDETISRTFSLDGGRALEVVNITGDINVIGTGGSEVELVARRSIRAETDADALDAAARSTLAVSASTPALSIATEPGRRSHCDEGMVESRNWRRDPYQITIDLELRVPRNAAVTLCTINGGSIQVDGVLGTFDLENVNGPIIMTGAGGSGRAVTVNGGVMASFQENPRAAAVFKTVNGDVNVAFRRDLSADLKMKTFRGGLFTDFDVVALPRVPTPARRNGMFVYRSDDAVLARVAKGGPEMSFETLNGDVRVLRRDN